MRENYHNVSPEERSEQGSRDRRALVWTKWGIAAALFIGWPLWGTDPFWRYFLATIFSFWILWVLLGARIP